MPPPPPPAPAYMGPASQTSVWEAGRATHQPNVCTRPLHQPARQPLGVPTPNTHSLSWLGAVLCGFGPCWISRLIVAVLEVYGPKLICCFSVATFVTPDFKWPSGLIYDLCVSRYFNIKLHIFLGYTSLICYYIGVKQFIEQKVSLEGNIHFILRWEYFIFPH